MNKFNDKGKKHGFWEHYINGKLWFKISYVNGKEHGLCEKYWDNGKIYIKQYYI